jgi:hypothetical protein
MTSDSGERRADSVSGVELATPFVVWRTACARHADRLFWVRGRTLCSEGVPQPTAAVVYFKLNGIKPNKNRSENIFSWKKYFTNRDQIRTLRVCVITALQIIYHV